MQKISTHTLILFLIVMISMSACRSKKATTQEVKPTSKSHIDSVFQRLKNNEIHEDWMRFSFKAEAKSTQGNYNFSGQIRIRKDSVIWMSLSPALGIEMIRLKITTDSVFMLNKLKKTYLRKPVSFINNFLGTDLDFDMVQSLLLGNDFTYYSREQFGLRENEKEYILNTVSRRKLKNYIDTAESVENLLIQKIHLSKENHKIIHQEIKQVRNPNKKLDVHYLQFEPVNFSLLPTLQQYSIKGIENVSLQLTFSKIKVNEKQRFPFKVSSSYKRI